MSQRPERRETSYESRPELDWAPSEDAALQPVPPVAPPHAIRKRRCRLAALALGATILAVSTLALLWPASSVPTARAWDIQVSSGGRRSVVAFVYGKEAGIQLVRIPPKGTTRLVQARLGEAPVYMVSLGWSGLSATGEAPPGERPMSWSANGRVVQAFSTRQGTGVRAW